MSTETEAASVRLQSFITGDGQPCFFSPAERSLV